MREEIQNMSRSRSSRNKKKRFPVFRTFLLLLFVAAAAVVLYAGKFLELDEPPVKSDAVIVLSGENGRYYQGIELQQAGYGKYLILTNSNAFKNKPNPVPDNLVLNENRATSTYTNATHTKVMMEERQLKSAIIVTSSYHMRRTKYIFDKVYEGTGIKLTYVAYHNPTVNLDNWLGDKKSRHYVIKEYIKLFSYAVLY